MILNLWLQIKYAKQLSYRLEQFEIKNNMPFLAWARCPMCGDSQKSKIKKRFYLYTKGQDIICQCHNCGYVRGLVKFLKEEDEVLYRQMMVEAFKEDRVDHTYNVAAEKKYKINENDRWKEFVIPAAMAPDGYKFLQKRKIPTKHWNRIYYTKNLNETYIDLCKTLEIEPDENKKIPALAGIFLPHLDKEGALVYSAWRNLDDTSSLRYVMLEYQPSYKIFGLELVDETKPIYVLEGQFDSMFLDNAVATGDANLERAAQCLPKDKLILVYDNEPRKKEGVNYIKKSIQNGFQVVMLPHSIQQKDLNDMHLAGHDVKTLVEQNVFYGLMANLHFSKWKKI